MARKITERAAGMAGSGLAGRTRLAAGLMAAATLLATCAPAEAPEPPLPVSGIVTPHSFLSNDLEFIRADDPGTLACFAYEGRQRLEMPVSRFSGLPTDGVHVFRAWHDDGAAVEYWAHPDLGSGDMALEAILPVAEAVGKLPTLIRGALHRVVLHAGAAAAFPVRSGQLFVVYSGNVEALALEGDLEEQVFTVSVQATIQQRFGTSPWWREAQLADGGGYVTELAARDPEGTDFSESALFAWAVLVHPGRLPELVERRVRGTMPHRLDFFEEMYFYRPLFTPLGREPDC